MIVELRDYQVRAIKAFYDAVRDGKRSIMLCAPTGAGKTEIAMGIASHFVKYSKSIQFLVDRDVLVRQTSQRFNDNTIAHGVASGPTTHGRRQRVQISSVQTVRSREIDLSLADLVVNDEAHIVHSHIAQAMESGKWLGLSATPFRKGLGTLYDTVINVATTEALVQQKHLAPLKVSCGVPVEAGKKSSSGEYDIRDLTDKAMKIVGNVMENWENRVEWEFGGPVKTIVFSNTVVDGEAMEKAFQDRGHAFRAVSYLTDQDEKEDTIAALREGHIDGIISCQMLQRGFDVPDIMCGIDCHPWRKSLSSVIQQAGRAMRTAPGKSHAVWLDHAQNFLRHRDRIFEFWRDGMDELVPKDNVAGEDAPDREQGVCPECEGIMRARVCTVCGWEAPVAIGGGRAVDGPQVVNGELVDMDTPLTGGKAVKSQVGRREYELPPPHQGWQQLCRMAQEDGRDAQKGQRWCQAQYRKLYGEFRRARYHADKHYPEPSPDLMAAVSHSTRLYQDKQKREHRKAA